MLKAAAERGVTVNVIIYKEVQAALTLDSAVSNSIKAPRNKFLAQNHCSIPKKH